MAEQTATALDPATAAAIALGTPEAIARQLGRTPGDDWPGTPSLRGAVKALGGAGAALWLSRAL